MIFNSYRQMLAVERQKASDGALKFIGELGNDRELQENTYRRFRFKLLNGDYRSKREKQLLLRVIDELKKVLES